MARRVFLAASRGDLSHVFRVVAVPRCPAPFVGHSTVGRNDRAAGLRGGGLCRRTGRRASPPGGDATGITARPAAGRDVRASDRDRVPRAGDAPVGRSAGLGDVGSLPPLCFAVGTTATFRTRRWPDSIVASAWGMLIGSTVWIVALLVTYYSFVGTPQERRLFDAENVWEDYRRSGEGDLRAFLMVDYCGACFFHLTLGPAMGAICGGTGGVITLTAVTLWCRRRET
jgi:hypothetical protein